MWLQFVERLTFFEYHTLPSIQVIVFLIFLVCYIFNNFDCSATSLRFMLLSRTLQHEKTIVILFFDSCHLIELHLTFSKALLNFCSIPNQLFIHIGVDLPVLVWVAWVFYLAKLAFLLSHFRSVCWDNFLASFFLLIYWFDLRNKHRSFLCRLGLFGSRFLLRLTLVLILKHFENYSLA